MASDIFTFKPAEIPQAKRGRKKSRYVATVDAVQKYLEENAHLAGVKLDLGGVAVKSAATSFRNALAKMESKTLRLVQRGEELYIQRR